MLMVVLLAALLPAENYMCPDGLPPCAEIDEKFEADEDFAHAVNTCALMVFGQQLKDDRIDPSQHGAAYDAAYARCRAAIGSLLEY